MNLLNIRKSTKRYIPYATVYNGPISSQQGINGLSSAEPDQNSVDTWPGCSSIAIRCWIRYQTVAENQKKQITNEVKVAFSLSFISNWRSIRGQFRSSGKWFTIHGWKAITYSFPMKYIRKWCLTHSILVSTNLTMLTTRHCQPLYQALILGIEVWTRDKMYYTGCTLKLRAVKLNFLSFFDAKVTLFYRTKHVT